MGFLHLEACVYMVGHLLAHIMTHLDGLMPAHVQNLLTIPKELAGSALCITAMQTARHVSTCPH